MLRQIDCSASDMRIAYEDLQVAFTDMQNGYTKLEERFVTEINEMAEQCQAKEAAEVAAEATAKAAAKAAAKEAAAKAAEEAAAKAAEEAAAKAAEEAAAKEAAAKAAEVIPTFRPHIACAFAVHVVPVGTEVGQGCEAAEVKKGCEAQSSKRQRERAQAQGYDNVVKDRMLYHNEKCTLTFSLKRGTRDGRRIFDFQLNTCKVRSVKELKAKAEELRDEALYAFVNNSLQEKVQSLSKQALDEFNESQAMHAPHVVGNKRMKPDNMLDEIHNSMHNFSNQAASPPMDDSSDFYLCTVCQAPTYSNFNGSMCKCAADDL